MLHMFVRLFSLFHAGLFARILFWKQTNIVARYNSPLSFLFYSLAFPLFIARYSIFCIHIIYILYIYSILSHSLSLSLLRSFTHTRARTFIHPFTIFIDALHIMAQNEEWACMEILVYFIGYKQLLPLSLSFATWSSLSLSLAYTRNRPFSLAHAGALALSRIITYNLFFLFVHRSLSSPLSFCEMPAKLESHVSGGKHTRFYFTSPSLYRLSCSFVRSPCFWHNQRQFGTVCVYIYIYIHICIYIYNI